MAKIKKEKTKAINILSFEYIALLLILVGAVIIILFFLSYWFEDFHFLGFSRTSADYLGPMGEYIGGVVGSLWSLAGIILFYEAIKFQRSELKLQREEIQSQRMEILEQTNQHIIQNQTLGIQKLESTFFQLISMHNDIVRGLTLDFATHRKNFEKSKKIIHGRYCFLHFYKYFTNIFNENVDLTGVSGDSTEDIKDIIDESFNMFYTEFQEDIGHYFRNLFNIALYIDKCKLNNKKFYYNLVKSLLSNYEIIMLFYFCLSKYGIKMKELTEKYSLFIQIPEAELLDRRHKNLFDSKAFEGDFEISIEDALSLRRIGSKDI